MEIELQSLRSQTEILQGSNEKLHASQKREAELLTKI